MNNKKNSANLEQLQEQGVSLIQMEVPDLDGVLRGKFLPLRKLKKDMHSAFCSILYQMTPADEVWMSQHSSFDNGFPDMLAVADMETAIQWPWQSKMGAVIFDILQADGSLHPLSPRSVLKKVYTLFAETGYQVKFGIEFEAFILHQDDALINSGRHHHELKPLGQMRNAYRLTDVSDIRDLSAAFMLHMQQIGIELDAFHTELGYGAIEFALAPQEPIHAADNAARSKNYFRQFCAQRGFVVTFMAKWKISESGSGGHVHQSLWRNGENTFYDGKSGFSELMLSYGAGLLKSMPDFSVIFRPNINSYRRFNHQTWSPENASWGRDNRSAALRAIAGKASAYRFEHRVPGADANIYLSLAAMLAGGHYGITEKLTPPKFAEGNATINSSFRNLPNTLLEATRLFRGSEITKYYFGELFVEHYAKSREIEWQYWLDWLAEEVTTFELKRYFNTL